jgi:hypothetical protein
MADEPVEKHQLAGLDERSRGFNRIVEVRQVEQAYRADLNYEAQHITADIGDSGRAALEALVRQLHSNGFTQLRSQLSFRAGEYLGGREPWIEYPDPREPWVSGLLARWLGRIAQDRTRP